MNIGYSFWGHLGDVKYDANGKPTNAPDGNAFYSWSIISYFQKLGNKVFHMMPDRDKVGFIKDADKLFDAWIRKDRAVAYRDMLPCTEIRKMDIILLEWRWVMNGRNDKETLLSYPTSFQPDYMIQHEILVEAKRFGIPVIVFDLDYKLTETDIRNYGIEYVLELGEKWKGNPLVKSSKVYIPFDFNHINDLPIKKLIPLYTDKVVYVGNRYERDWAIDKYLPDGSVIYGNWLKGGRDSDKRWPRFEFRDQLQTKDMYEAYSKGVVTPLLAKKEYCEMGFMTARIIEAVFYGCIPLFIEEFSKNDEYIPFELRNLLVVKDKDQVEMVAYFFAKNDCLRDIAIMMLREHLKFMDVKNFVDSMFELVKGEF